MYLTTCRLVPTLQAILNPSLIFFNTLSHNATFFFKPYGPSASFVRKPLDSFPYLFPYLPSLSPNPKSRDPFPSLFPSFPLSKTPPLNHETRSATVATTLQLYHHRPFFPIFLILKKLQASTLTAAVAPANTSPPDQFEKSPPFPFKKRFFFLQYISENSTPPSPRPAVLLSSFVRHSFIRCDPLARMFLFFGTFFKKGFSGQKFFHRCNVICPLYHLPPFVVIFPLLQQCTFIIFFKKAYFIFEEVDGSIVVSGALVALNLGIMLTDRRLFCENRIPLCFVGLFDSLIDTVSNGLVGA